MGPTDLARTGGISRAARQRILSRRGEPLFLADWDRVVFIHYEIDPGILQPEVPFQLDLRCGKAYVSLVAFTMRRMRPRFGGKPAEWIFKPIATHEFLNVRTYVRHNGERGIYFLAEWLTNRLAVHLGPRTFGLPYRFGRITYRHPVAGELRGVVAGDSGRIEYAASVPEAAEFRACAENSLEEFLLERYTAFTHLNARSRLFRIWHRPWQQCSVELKSFSDSLLWGTWPWWKEARLIGANFSPGAQDVWMGRPHAISV